VEPVRYRELPPPHDLRDLLACCWQRTVPAGGGHELILPDGCVDVIWLGGGRLVVAGPDTGPATAVLDGAVEIVGLRLRRGLAGAVLGLPASALRDERVPLEEVWGREGADLAERVRAEPDATGVRRALERALAARRARAAPADRLVLRGVDRLDAPGARVDALAADLGVSERQLRRRFDAAVGYGPKVLGRVLRLARLRSLAAADPADDLARLAAEAGYADQSHMSRDCLRLTGQTPAALLRTRPAETSKTRGEVAATLGA
jgi:AraC-like DNA-binding protein